MPPNSAGATAPGTDMLARMTMRHFALVEDHRLAGDEVGGDGAERNGQLVEVE